jgi:alpha-glucosidase
VQLDAPLEHILALMKADSIIPMEHETELTLHLYPLESSECTSDVYSDAGNGYGEFRVDRFHLTRDDHELELN